MQIEKKLRDPKFKPVELKLVFETEEELGEFYSIFNYSPIVECLDAIDPVKIRQELGVPYGIYSKPHTRLNAHLERRR